MKSDLDRLMAERALDAIVVSGKMNGNPALYYAANGARLINGWVIKKWGEERVLMSSAIDREEAAASGLRVVTLDQYDWEGITRQAPNRLAADVELYRRLFADLGVSGRVGFYGMADQSRTWALLSALDEQLDGLEVCGEGDNTLIDVARATKDTDEAARIREVGRRTAAIMGQTVEYLRSHGVKNGALIEADGTPLTIGRVHKEIGRLLTEQGLDVPEGVIFAIGRDAGVPHNKGNPADVVALGQTIIFDFGTREVGGGYYFDMTRTFCLGYAPPEIEKVYRDVYDCVQVLTGAYRAGTETQSYMQKACELFESRGYPTLATDTTARVGFVHGLGHGIGLAVHEEPFFSLAPSSRAVLEPGHIFTCEPGLYNPDRGWGLRIEDVIWIDLDGVAQNLTDFPKELVIPV
jgi:Xaa-Pro aminopeptidase